VQLHCTMPTTCAIVGRKTRQSKGIPCSFYRIPPEPECRYHWLAFINRKNEDRIPWRPGTGDRVCSDNFISGKKSDVSGILFLQCPLQHQSRKGKGQAQLVQGLNALRIELRRKEGSKRTCARTAAQPKCIATSPQPWY